MQIEFYPLIENCIIIQVLKIFPLRASSFFLSFMFHSAFFVKLQSWRLVVIIIIMQKNKNKLNEDKKGKKTTKLRLNLSSERDKDRQWREKRFFKATLLKSITR